MAGDLDLDLLRSFAMVAETRHFTQAAERLNRAQSAVSMQIQRLEALVGVPLLERSKRRVKLTPEGEVFQQYASRMLRLNDETLALFGDRGVQGRVRVAATDTSMCFVPPILSRFAQSYPLVELELRCERSWTALDALEVGEVDLALVSQDCGRSGGQVVARDPLVWAVARHSAADEVEPLPLALFGPGCIYRDIAVRELEKAGRRYRHAYNSASREGLNAAVAAGLAVTILPRRMLDGGLRVLGAEEGFPELPEMEISLYRGSARPSPPVTVFAELTAATLAAG
jgi:DNA-binding transcriptional LysR family regulator